MRWSMEQKENQKQEKADSEELYRRDGKGLTDLAGGRGEGVLFQAVGPLEQAQMQPLYRSFH